MVLNDAYNANPTSMAAALRALAALPARRRVAVLGLMAELGPVSDAEHTRRRRRWPGTSASRSSRSPRPPTAGRPWAASTTSPAALGPLGDGDAVLLKGSRVAGLERLVELLESPV